MSRWIAVMSVFLALAMCLVASSTPVSADMLMPDQGTSQIPSTGAPGDPAQSPALNTGSAAVEDSTSVRVNADDLQKKADEKLAVVAKREKALEEPESAIKSEIASIEAKYGTGISSPVSREVGSTDYRVEAAHDRHVQLTKTLEIIYQTRKGIAADREKVAIEQQKLAAGLLSEAEKVSILNKIIVHITTMFNRLTKAEDAIKQIGPRQYF